MDSEQRARLEELYFISTSFGTAVGIKHFG